MTPRRRRDLRAGVLRQQGDPGQALLGDEHRVTLDRIRSALDNDAGSTTTSSEPVYLRWKGLEKTIDGDFYVRSGPGTVRFGKEDAEKYVATRFGSK